MSRPKPQRPAALTIITNSELGTFRECPMKHHFRYREKLRPKVEGRALAIGSVFHHGMSAGIVAGYHPQFARGKTNEERLAAQIAAAQSDVAAELMDWAGRTTAHGVGVDFAALEEDAADGAEMLKWALASYFTSTVLDLDELRLVETEAAFKINVRDRLGRRGRVEFQGVRDAVFYAPKYNAVILHEHKTVSSAPSDIEKRAELDPQTNGYTYALKEEHAAGKLWYYDLDDPTTDQPKPVPANASLGSVAYNAIKKKKPSTPKLNKDGTVSAAQIDTLGSIYRAALEDQVRRGHPVTDKQLVLLGNLEQRTGAYFHRHEFVRNQSDLDRWRSDTVIDAGRIRAADRDPAMRTRNPGNCTMPWSMKCEYRGVCIDDTPELRAQFRKLEDAHPELREEEAKPEPAFDVGF